MQANIAPPHRVGDQQSTMSSSSSTSRDGQFAIRAALVRLLDSEESLPDDYMPELNAAALLLQRSAKEHINNNSSTTSTNNNNNNNNNNSSSSSHSNYYQERRVGSCTSGTDILGSTNTSVQAGAPTIKLPADRLTTTVTFSGFADPSIAGTSADISTDTGVSSVTKQREAHHQNLVLLGANMTGISSTTTTTSSSSSSSSASAGTTVTGTITSASVRPS